MGYNIVHIERLFWCLHVRRGLERDTDQPAFTQEIWNIVLTYPPRKRYTQMAIPKRSKTEDLCTYLPPPRIPVYGFS